MLTEKVEELIRKILGKSMDSTQEVWGHQQKEFVILLFIMLC